MKKNILSVQRYQPDTDTVNVVLQDLPRKWLYAKIASLSTTPQGKFVYYTKSSPRSNQTVGGVQNLGDITAPTAEITLYRNATDETVSTGNTHDAFINTRYTLKALRTDNVVVKQMILQYNGQTITKT